MILARHSIAVEYNKALGRLIHETRRLNAFEVAAMVHTEFGMSSLDYWRFCQVLTVVQAAILIVGEDPSRVIPGVRGNLQDWPTGYEPVMAALLGDIKRKLLPADVPEGRDDERQETFPLWEQATIWWRISEIG
jgi:hypothetical protein